MGTLVNAWTVGLIFTIMALGVLISYRIFHFPDITVDGTFTLGASVVAVLTTGGLQLLLTNIGIIPLLAKMGIAIAISPEWGKDPLFATVMAVLFGMAAGATTGVLHTKFKVDAFLAAILVMTALYSVNLRVMGKSNLSVPEDHNLIKYTESLEPPEWLVRMAPESEDPKLAPGNYKLWVWEGTTGANMVLLLVFLLAIGVAVVLYLFLRTNLGTALRATGDNDQMIRALGVNVGNMTIFSLALSNGLVAFAGALFAQFQGFSDAQLGIGTLVMGLASVIVGEALVRSKQLGLAITGTIMGAILYQLLLNLALYAGLNPIDTKLVTALFVFAALVGPNVVARLGARMTGGLRHA